MTFLRIGIIDFIDIILVAFIFYQIYMLMKGTVAIKIFTGVAALYFIWLVVKALNMRLLSTILGQVMGVGVIALLIVFQQEIRSFFMLISNKYFSKFELSGKKLLSIFSHQPQGVKVTEIIDACVNMSKKKIGALIVISRRSELGQIRSTGTELEAKTSSLLIQNIFFKNSPLHDGAMVITKEKIKAAGCILPVSQNKRLPESFGLRHRSAYGITENTDSIVVVVSEETGNISFFETGNFITSMSTDELSKILEDRFPVNNNTNYNTHTIKEKLLSKLTNLKEKI